MSHIEYLKEIVTQPLEFFRKEVQTFEERRAAAVADGGPYRLISELREESIKKNGISRRVRRVFVETDDLAGYIGVGWVLCVDAEFCMVCQRDFGMFYDPHVHCHACGNIVCRNCVDEILVQELRKIGPVPVCKFCDWGQDVIHIVPSVDNRRSVAAVPQRRPKYTDINLWNYGRIAAHPYTPVFVLRTRRVDKSRVFINIGVCDAVPCNPKGILTSSTDRLPLGKGGAVDYVQHTVSYEDMQSAKRLDSNKQNNTNNTITNADNTTTSVNNTTINTTNDNIENTTDTNAITTSGSVDGSEHDVVTMHTSSGSHSSVVGSDSELEDIPVDEDFAHGGGDSLLDSDDEYTINTTSTIHHTTHHTHSVHTRHNKSHTTQTHSQNTLYSTLHSTHTYTSPAEYTDLEYVQFEPYVPPPRRRIVRTYSDLTDLTFSDTESSRSAPILKYGADSVGVGSNGAKKSNTNTPLSLHPPTPRTVHTPRTPATPYSVHSPTNNSRHTARTHHLPTTFTPLAEESILPVPRRVGYSRTQAYYEFSDSSEATTSDDSEPESVSGPDKLKGDSIINKESSGSRVMLSGAVSSGAGVDNHTPHTYNMQHIQTHHTLFDEHIHSASVSDESASSLTYNSSSANPQYTTHTTNNASSVQSELEVQLKQTLHYFAYSDVSPHTFAAHSALHTVHHTTHNLDTTHTDVTTIHHNTPELASSSGVHTNTHPTTHPTTTTTANTTTLNTERGYDSGADSELESIPEEVAAVLNAHNTTNTTTNTAINTATNTTTTTNDITTNTATVNVTGTSNIRPAPLLTLDIPTDHTYTTHTMNTMNTTEPDDASVHSTWSSTQDSAFVSSEGSDEGSEGSVEGSVHSVGAETSNGVPVTGSNKHSAHSSGKHSSVHSSSKNETHTNTRINSSPDLLNINNTNNTNNNTADTPNYTSSSPRRRGNSNSSVKSEWTTSTVGDGTHSTSTTNTAIRNTTRNARPVSAIQTLLNKSLAQDLRKLGLNTHSTQEIWEKFNAAQIELQHTTQNKHTTQFTHDTNDIHDTSTIVTNTTDNAEYEAELPIDTYLVCNEMGTSVDYRQVYDVCVNPQVIEACNADLSGQMLLKLCAQVLMSVSHVHNEQRFPYFEFHTTEGNYLPRYKVKDAEQLADEARELQMYQHRRAARLARQSVVNSVLQYVGLGGVELGNEAEGADVVEEKPTFPDQVDNAPLMMQIPAPVAFKHLTAVYSYSTIRTDMPKHYHDSSAVYSTYEAARATLQSNNTDVIYQSMVHKLKNKPRVTFAAATFSLVEYNKTRNSKYISGDDVSDFGDYYSESSVRERSSTTNTLNTINTTHTTNTSNTFYSQDSTSTGTYVHSTIPKIHKSVTLIAKPAFVIKTYRTTTTTKIFINVLHHECFDVLLINDVIRVAPHEEPLTGLGDSYTTVDKNQCSAVVYNVLIASSYIKKVFRRFEKRITDPSFIKTIIETINATCADSLTADHYSLPRTKRQYKGCSPTYKMTFVFSVAAADSGRGAGSSANVVTGSGGVVSGTDGVVNSSAGGSTSGSVGSVYNTGSGSSSSVAQNDNNSVVSNTTLNTTTPNNTLVHSTSGSTNGDTVRTKKRFSLKNAIEKLSPRFGSADSSVVSSVYGSVKRSSDTYNTTSVDSASSGEQDHANTLHNTQLNVNIRTSLSSSVDGAGSGIVNSDGASVVSTGVGVRNSVHNTSANSMLTFTTNNTAITNNTTNNTGMTANTAEKVVTHTTHTTPSTHTTTTPTTPTNNNTTAVQSAEGKRRWSLVRRNTPATRHTHNTSADSINTTPTNTSQLNSADTANVDSANNTNPTHTTPTTTNPTTSNTQPTKNNTTNGTITTPNTPSTQTHPNSNCLVTTDMVLYVKELSIDKYIVESVKKECIHTPQVLLGWQLVVVLKAGEQAGLFVVTAIRTSKFTRTTKFQLSHPHSADKWVRLKRHPKKHRKGLFFYPTRKVLFLEHTLQDV